LNENNLAVTLSHQDGHYSAVALLLKAALIQVSDYRLLGASGYWFQTRRFLCEFPIGSYVKLSSAVGAIVVEGPNRRTHFWKRTIQWKFT
jgi:hypothetical protein